MLGNKEIMANNIRHYMNINNKSRNEMCEALGIAYTTFSDWINGNKYPRIDKIELMANYFGISKSDLVEERSSKPKTSECVRIPVYSKIPAGIPSEAIEDIIDWEEIPASWQGEYISIKFKGDSMSPRIMEGDYIIVRRQPDADSGDIVVAKINGQDSTCKRLIKYENSIMLQPLNSAYEPLVFTMKECKTLPVEIWGKVVENRAKF